jgi:hypothetical protein
MKTGTSVLKMGATKTIVDAENGATNMVKAVLVLHHASV